jgi:hypothetical protein
MTNYATKDDIKMHQLVIRAAVLRLSLEQVQADTLTGSDPEPLNNDSRSQRSKCDVDWSKFALRLYNRFAREHEISGVTIANHILQQPAFFLPHGEQRKVNINLLRVRFEVMRLAMSSDCPELREILEETDRNQYSEFSSNQVTFYMLYDNYRYRGQELSAICFYEYCSQIQVVKLRYARSTHIRFDIRHPRYDSLCQIVAGCCEELITPSIYGKTTDYENKGEAVAGDLLNSGPVWNDHCKVVLGLFVLWDLLPSLFKERSDNFEDPSDASSLIWKNIRGSQLLYIQQLATNLELLWRSKKDAKADKLAREFENMDMDDLDDDDYLAVDKVTDGVPYSPETLTEKDLFQVFLLHELL